METTIIYVETNTFTNPKGKEVTWCKAYYLDPKTNKIRTKSISPEYAELNKKMKHFPCRAIIDEKEFQGKVTNYFSELLPL